MKDKRLDWLIDWLVGWLVDWLGDWLVDWLTDRLNDCLTGLRDWQIACLTLVGFSDSTICEWVERMTEWASHIWHMNVKVDTPNYTYRCKCMRPMLVMSCLISVFFVSIQISAIFIEISEHLFKAPQASYLQLLLCGQESFCNCAESLEGASVDSCLKMGCRGCAWLLSLRTQLSAVGVFLMC